MLEILLILNILWFTGGYITFGPRGEIFARSLVAREHRDTPVFSLFIHTGNFMGGFNFAFAALNALLLFNTNVFDQDLQWAILLTAIAIAHGSQFGGNLPTAIRNRRGEGVWDVWKGLMLLIFVVDFTLMVLNGVAAGIYFL